MNDPRDTPPHERAFDRVFTVLLNESLDSRLATFFLTTFGRKDVRDIVLCNSYRSNVAFSSFTRDEKLLISSVNFFYKYFTDAYGYFISSDWSNVSTTLFDHLIAEGGFDPIERNIEESCDLFDSDTPSFFDASQRFVPQIN